MSTIPTDVHALFLALKAQADSIHLVNFDQKAGVWSVEFNDGALVVAVWGHAPARLVFKAGLGVPPAHRKDRVHEAVLLYNTLWPQTGGAHIGLSDSTSGLALMVEVPIEGLEIEHLLYVLEQIWTAAASWSQFVAAPGDADPSALIDPIVLVMRA